MTLKADAAARRRNVRALLWARHEKIAPQNLVTELSKPGQGLDAWAKLWAERERRVKKRVASEQKADETRRKGKSKASSKPSRDRENSAPWQPAPPVDHDSWPPRLFPKPVESAFIEFDWDDDAKRSVQGVRCALAVIEFGDGSGTITRAHGLTDRAKLSDRQWDDVTRVLVHRRKNEASDD